MLSSLFFWRKRCSAAAPSLSVRVRHHFEPLFDHFRLKVNRWSIYEFQSRFIYYDVSPIFLEDALLFCEIIDHFKIVLKSWASPRIHKNLQILLTWVFCFQLIYFLKKNGSSIECSCIPWLFFQIWSGWNCYSSLLMLSLPVLHFTKMSLLWLKKTLQGCIYC